MSQPPYSVIDPRLAAGRGEEFSASRQNEKLQASYQLDGSIRMPIDQRIEDSLDTEGMHMASTSEAIPQSNVGFQMLQKMGWKGQGLGSNEDGIREPVGGGAEAGVRLGLGKQQEDDFYTAPDNIQRKRLETEVQATEDETRAAKREVEAEREQKIKEDVTLIKRTFYCEVCNKQYASALELEVHLSSYDHHHRKRLVEMRSAENERTRKGRDRKEKRRQEKELLRLNTQIQKARGRSPTQADGPPLPLDPPPPPPETDTQPHTEAQPQDVAQEASVGMQAGARSTVQFNMGLSASKNSGAVKGPKFQQIGLKKPGRPPQKVAGFSADSDDE